MILANKLTSAQHSVALLEAEIKDLHTLLERDEEFLDKLKKNAKTEQHEQQRRKAKVFIL